ncbi:L-lysine 6-monooxygenase [Rhodococcus sp. RS1C4]|uniref:L-lysine N6-monooxygenase MbtG n=2 Tax=Nocardiaceae TaxID=85025 RepID=G8JYX7_RHOFA|nr:MULTISPECIES: SidA/IucD/PvdA family monooxygenase [Rhodococcus]AET25248.1 putative peptide monooxygenase [Rhodococcus fascians D188]AMY56274.1 L-ornithine N(5)-monooxygenase [Rhodococcus fascians D188]OZC43781.1 L-lysine 6-monooxygenase [Rhodococcus sp. RS1C4]OZC51313.1 L-lysine 6-monooxygenase [Rhodococcus sp. 06-621-2]OZC60732.1 L-lysine 6-monooxygenase [Rhodococcus sp. 06-469-3-2]
MGAQSGSSVADVVGVGFGPSNLALAIALQESIQPGPVPAKFSMKFYELQPRFGWHRGMLMEDATMQVSFLKDLATMRNPMSRYTFVSYLREKERIAEFINSKTLYPLRVEFHDYLEWAASQFQSNVSYGSEIKDIRPVVENGVVEYVDVVGPDDVVQRARNIVIGMGLTPRLPDGVNRSERIWHSSQLLGRAAAVTYVPQNFVVVGSGQSAAEVADYLHRTFPRANVHTVLSRYGYSVADDSPYANGIFDPEGVDRFFSAPTDEKQRLLEYHANTNYSVVDLDISQSLYLKSYQEKVLGKQRLRMINTSRVTSVDEDTDGVRVEVTSSATGLTHTIEADVIVYATGYRPSDPAPLLQGLMRECKHDEQGRLSVGRDYRVTTSDAVRAGIYVHGASTEHSHGLSAGLLSNTAVRSGEIAQSILRR